MKPYGYFSDEMVEGDFKLMKHNHFFKAVGRGNEIYFPYSNLSVCEGRSIVRLFVVQSILQKKLLSKRNAAIKQEAERFPEPVLCLLQKAFTLLNSPSTFIFAA